MGVFQEGKIMNQKLARRPFAVSDLHPEVRGQFSALTEALVWAYQTDRTAAMPPEILPGLAGEPRYQNEAFPLFCTGAEKANRPKAGFALGVTLNAGNLRGSPALSGNNTFPRMSGSRFRMSRGRPIDAAFGVRTLRYWGLCFTYAMVRPL